MTRATITRQISVVEATALPLTGFAKLVAPFEGHQTVRPPGLTSPLNWRYLLFGSFGSGCFTPYYSERGAYVIAASGGRARPPYFGAAVFDWTTMQWGYLPCANAGLPFDASDANMDDDLTSKAPFWEMLGVTEGHVPSPSHLYKKQVVLPPAHGGGSKGSVLQVTRASVNSAGGAEAGTVHAFDLVTRKWTRLSAEDSFGAGGTEDQVVFDPVAVRYYRLRGNEHNSSGLQYWDPVTTRFEQGPTQAVRINDNTSGGPYGVSAFIHEGGGVRALIFCRRDPLTGSHTLAGIDLDNQAAGWVRRLTIEGDPIPNASAGWIRHDAHNAYYRRLRSGAGQTIHRLVPPTGNPLTGTWAHGSVTLQGDTIPEAVGQTQTEYSGYLSLMYIPSLQMLGWVTAQGVALLNP